MAQADTDLTVEFTSDVALLQALADGVNEVGYREAVFEFEPDRLRIGCQDPASAFMSEQIVTPDAFESYEVPDPIEFGMDTGKLDELLTVAGPADTVTFDLDYARRSVTISFADVAYDLSGIDTDNVNGRLTEIPDYDDPDYTYTVYATAPVDGLQRAGKIVDLADYTDNVAHFRMGGTPTFVIGGDGDLDQSRVDIHTHDDFEWDKDPPDAAKTVKIENAYLKTIPKLCDGTVYTVTGDNLPVFFETTRADDRIDTTFAVAPRIKTT